MNKATTSPKRREYSSRLREEQAEQTRERILESVAAMLRAGDLEEISFASVARNAGVSVPTVYRYFPSRDALFEGVQEWLNRELKAPPFPKSWEDLAEGSTAMFAYYENARDIFKTAMVTSLFREVGQANRRRRDRAVAELLSPLTRHLDERRANAIHAMLRLIYGFEGFSFMRERFGSTPEEIAEVVAWATRTLTAQLLAEQAAAGRTNGRGTKKTTRSPK